MQQLVLLSCIFLVLAVICDTGYVLLAAKIKPLLQGNFLAKCSDSLTGLIYLVAGAWLAFSKRS